VIDDENIPADEPPTEPEESEFREGESDGAAIGPDDDGRRRRSLRPRLGLPALLGSLRPVFSVAIKVSRLALVVPLKLIRFIPVPSILRGRSAPSLLAGRSVSPPAMAGVVLALVVIGVLGWLALSGGSEPADHQDEVELALVDAADGPDAEVHHDAAPADEVTPDGVDLEEAGEFGPVGTGGSKPVADLEEEVVASSVPEHDAAATGRSSVESEVSGGAGYQSSGLQQSQGLRSEVAPDPVRETVRLARIDPALQQQTSRGPLPIIGADGRESWRVYARPSQAGAGAPRLALVIVGLGLSSAAIETAMALSGAVTLSFTPYAPMLEETVKKARDAGHEVLMDLPMEPVSYPADDPGPHTLLTSLNPTDNIARLEWLLGRFSGYVGVVSHMGSRFTTSPEALRPVMTALRDRGLMFVDSQASSKSVATNVAAQLALPFAVNSIFVDHEPTRAAIDRTFADLEASVLRSGTGIAIARAFPVTLERLAAWLPALEERGIVLVPISALAEHQ
jgi:uncharacterized protein